MRRSVSICLVLAIDEDPSQIPKLSLAFTETTTLEAGRIFFGPDDTHGTGRRRNKSSADVKKTRGRFVLTPPVSAPNDTDGENPKENGKTHYFLPFVL